MTDTPDWKETREKILNQGVKEADLDKKVADYRAKFGQFISTDDMLYYMLAQREYKLSMPKIASSDGQKSSTAITLSEVQPGLKARFVKVKAYILSIRQREGKKGPYLIVTLADGRNTARLKAFKQESQDHLLATIKEGQIYELDGVGVFPSEARGDWPASCDLTWATNVRAEKLNVSVDNFLANAAVIPLQPGQPCFYRGFVIDDNPRTYSGCKVCKKSVAKNNGVCPNHPREDVEEYRMYSFTMSDGNSRFKVDFGARGPKDSVHGSVLTVVGRYNSEHRCIEGEKYDLIEKTVVPKHAEVVKAVETRNGNTATASKLRNITPDEILIQYVQKYGSNPKGPIVYKLKEDCGLTEQQANDFLAARQMDGKIKVEADKVVWTAPK